MTAMTPEPQMGATSDLMSVWVVLRKNKFLVIGIVTVFTVAALAAAFLTRPVYRASVLLIPAETGDSPVELGAMLGDLGGLASLAGLNLGGANITVEALATLRSRQFTEEFVEQNDLLPTLFADDWDVASGTWKVSGDDVPTLWDAYQLFDRKIRRAVEDKKTGLVRVEIDWTDRVAAAAWANELVARLNEVLRTRAIREADASVEYLQQELKKTDVVQLQQAIYRLIEANVKRRTVATVRPEFAFRVLDPAAPPDPDDFVQPKRALYLIAGPVAGLLFAVCLVLAVDYLRRELVAAGS
jgi:uncharacterized protein involved in exopolysaccharide biosynthesis